MGRHNIRGDLGRKKSSARGQPPEDPDYWARKAKYGQKKFRASNRVGNTHGKLEIEAVVTEMKIECPHLDMSETGKDFEFYCPTCGEYFQMIPKGDAKGQDLWPNECLSCGEKALSWDWCNDGAAITFACSNCGKVYVLQEAERDRPECDSPPEYPDDEERD